MKELRTHGLLLKKVFLANDDAILTFFTPDHGKISVFVPKFTRSKKKAAEIDFFRILELEIFEGRNSYRLKTAFVGKVFRGFEDSFEQTESGFLYLRILDEILQENHPDHKFFKQIISIFQHIGDHPFLTSFFWVKIFCFLGIFPRCDYYREAVNIQTQENIQISPLGRETQNNSGVFALGDKDRQVLEFLRRSDFEDFWLKKEKLPPESLQILGNVMHSIAHYHLRNYL